MRRDLISMWAAAMFAAASGASFAEDTPLKFVDPDGTAGTSAAVVVAPSATLALTGRILPLDGENRIVAPGDPDRQSAALLDRLDAVLREAGTSAKSLVRLNVYAVDDRALAAFRKTLASRSKDGARPTLVHVVTAFSKKGTTLALDAVATAPAGTKPSGDRFGILPPGSRVFVSGQAKPAKSLEEATTATLEELGETLAFLKLDRSKVVHLKAFVEPIGSIDAVERAIGKFFGPGGVPPRSFVEWRSTPTTPIEIELVVHGGRESGAEGVEYLTPPALKPSPVFSRVARVGRSGLVYTSSLTGPAGGDGKAQVEAIFADLGRILSRSGGDFQRLAKATYYVSAEDSSRALNDVRPRFYHPARPPAASKAMVTGVGLEGRSVAIDLIGAVEASGRAF